MKTFARALVVVIWLAVMAWLAVRSHADRPQAPPPPPAGASAPAGATEAWHGIYGDGRKVGYSHRVLTPTADGFRVDTDTSIELRLLGAEQPVLTHLTAETDRGLRLREFDFRLRSGDNDVTIRGEVKGERLEITSNKLGTQTIALSPEAPLALSETLQDVLGRETLVTGKTLRYSVFDPVSAGPTTVALHVGPLESVALPSGPRSAYRVEQEYQGSRFHLWIEPGGEVVKEEGPLGLTIVRETDAASALRGIDPRQGLDLAAAAAVPVAHAIAAPRDTRRLALRVAGIPADRSLAFPPRQSVQGDRLTIEREAPAAIGSFRLPARDPRFAADLRATPFLQVDDPQIVASAKQATGETADARTAAQRLVGWVHERLAKIPTVSIPNAIEVLEQGRGDCNEHAVLYAALARASGLPARIASGVVYLPGRGESGGAFYYHAWDEVWLGDWTAVDPTFGQFPADATHVKLTSGGPENDTSLVGMIGRLRLDVLDAF